MQKKILVVDDEVDLVETLTMALEAAGYKIDQAFDGEQALQKIESFKPDVVLLDIMMPKVNGYKVCWEIKNNPHTHHTRIIMLSAKALEVDKFWGYETGTDDYITKPFDLAHLVNRIMTLSEENLQESNSRLES